MLCTQKSQMMKWVHTVNLDTQVLPLWMYVINLQGTKVITLSPMYLNAIFFQNAGSHLASKFCHSSDISIS